MTGLSGTAKGLILALAVLAPETAAVEPEAPARGGWPVKEGRRGRHHRRSINPFDELPAGRQLRAPRRLAPEPPRANLSPPQNDRAAAAPPGGAAAQPPAAGEPRPVDLAALKQTALSDPDPEERISALQSLAFEDENAALPVLTSALQDPEKSVRIAALQELEDYSQLPFDTVASALGDQDAEVRAEALRILGDSDDDRAVALARQALDDPNEDVRDEAQGIIEDAQDGQE
jgi:hypothetical protein